MTELGDQTQEIDVTPATDVLQLDLLAPRLRAFINKKYGWAGPDFVQEVLWRTIERAYDRSHRFDATKSSFFTWLCWQCRTVAREVRREWYDPKLVPLDEESHEPWATSPGPAELVEAERQFHEQRLAFESLPLVYRRSINLHDNHGYKLDETARRMGVPVWKVQEVINRGRDVLQRRLQERGVRPIEVDCMPPPVWHGWDNTGDEDDFTASETAVLPVGPSSVVGAAAEDDDEEELDN